MNDLLRATMVGWVVTAGTAHLGERGIPTVKMTER
jgi:hypothetical protein